MNIVPRPFLVKPASGEFHYRSDIGAATDIPVIAAMFGGAREDARIVFVKEPVEWDHVIEITSESVTAKAATDEGLFHAAVSLLQLIGGKKECSLRCCTIFDKPRYAYRAGMIDVCRHFFGLDTLKKLIDTMALFKFNFLHFHVSDDQGFRLRIDGMPRLHQIGSVRAGTCGDGKPHGGYYSKEEISDLVAYAKERYIEVIPEIDLPGHTRAIVAAYPELSCSGKKTTVATWFGIQADVLCTGKERVYDALDTIFKEVAEMFPCKYFHLGGDEVPKTAWAKCPDCAALYLEEGMENLEQLQGHFTNRVIKLLEKHGKTPILWNEALKSDMLDPSAVVQYWTTDRASAELVGKAVREQGRKVIMSRCDPYYLDYPCGMHPLSAMYALDPAKELGSEEGVLGVECPLWTEHVSEEKDLFEHFYPRAVAVAETGWSTPEKDYEDFKARLAAVLPLVAAKGVAFTPLAACDPGKAESAFAAASFGLKMQRRADIRSGINWRNIWKKKPSSSALAKARGSKDRH